VNFCLIPADTLEIEFSVYCEITEHQFTFTYDNRETLEKFIRDLQSEGFGWNRVNETKDQDLCVWIHRTFLFHSNRKTSLFDLGVKQASVVRISSSPSFSGPGCPCSILFRGYSNHTKDGPWGSITFGDAYYPMGSDLGRHQQFFHTYVDTSTVKCTIHVVQGKETYTIATDRDFQDVCQTSISKIWESMGSGFQSHQLHNSLVIFNFSGPVSHI
jgi:hypothetical protein